MTERLKDAETERAGKKKIRSHTDLDVYVMAFQEASVIYDLTKSFPKEELYSLTDQIRRSSRSVCANIAEAFRKRKYPKSFIAKLSDSESEAAETQVWLQFSYRCKYIDKISYENMYKSYNNIIGKLVNMAIKPDSWSF